MKKFKKIAIVGVGLIGGSIGLAIKKKGLAKEVVGVFRRRSTLDRAMKHRAVDRGTLDLKKGVAGADLVIIATNVGTIPRVAGAVAPLMPEGGILTDVGSVKAAVTEDIARSIPGGVVFVGSHPMAGSEKTGVENARPDLFEGAVTILTRQASTDRKALERMAAFWKRLGARVRILSPGEHDERVAMISHLPHLAAVGLVGAQDKKGLELAANGFRDTTRVASSDPEMWIDILENNRGHVIAAMDRFIKELGLIRKALSRREMKALAGKLERAKRIRDSIV